MTETRLQSSVTQQHGNDRPCLKPCQMWDISCTAAPKREVGTLSFLIVRGWRRAQSTAGTEGEDPGVPRTQPSLCINSLHSHSICTLRPRH